MSIISVKEYYVKEFGVKVDPPILKYQVVTSDSFMEVPKNEDNADYRNILVWIAEGNTPEPADE